MNRSSHYRLLSFILAFYLAAQLFQQYVLRLGPMSGVAGLEQTIIAGQHPLNHVRMSLILLSMFLMVPGTIILGGHFYRTRPLLSVVAIVFFLFFCLYEVTYRSIQLFQVMLIWGKEFAAANAGARAALLPKFQAFYETVNALYFPLLASFLAGSACLCAAAWNDRTARPVAIAMGIHSIQQLSRLSGYTPFEALNVFTGIWYFVIVAIVFGLLLYWSVKMSREGKAFGL